MSTYTPPPPVNVPPPRGYPPKDEYPPQKHHRKPQVYAPVQYAQTFPSQGTGCLEGCLSALCCCCILDACNCI